uniref:Nuclear receptor n=1 Tax=Tigriopus japonicus TaxID=158387 RepID=A0A0A7CJF5_TIGJA|nr:nuclear receptor [Tigriopus japonicus]
METLFQSGELDLLVNEILSEGPHPSYYESITDEPLAFSSTSISAKRPNSQKHYDLDTISLQELMNVAPVECDTQTITNDPNIVSQTEDSSDFSDTPRTPNLSKPHRECPVCDNPSGKHSYYGAQVCFSCRAFFRRSTINSTFTEFQCKDSKTCGINSKSWKSCKFCRYQKCLSAGMKSTWVLNDEERVQRNANRKRLRKIREAGVAFSETFIGNQWTTDEEHQIRQARNDFLLKGFGVIAQFCSSNPNIFDRYVDCLNGNTPFDPMLVGYTRRFIYSEVMKSISDLLIMKDIHPVDRFLLLSHNYPLWVSFEEAVQFRNHQEMEKIQQTFSKCIRTLKSSSDLWPNANIDHLQRTFDKLSVHDNANFLDKLNNLITDQSMRRRRTQLITSIQSWPKISSRGLADDILLTLMTMILIFSSDSLKLQSEGVVSKIQNQYCYMLYRYVNFKSPGKAHVKLGEGMEIVSKVREVMITGEAALNKSI